MTRSLRIWIPVRQCNIKKNFWAEDDRDEVVGRGQDSRRTGGSLGATEEKTDGAKAASKPVNGSGEEKRLRLLVVERPGGCSAVITERLGYNNNSRSGSPVKPLQTPTLSRCNFEFVDENGMVTGADFWWQSEFVDENGTAVAQAPGV
ncbi:hypothetical protein Daus18300_000279 [Diaporthe australafricana]|uniref:Uncharacterized protein n=1 Tax=Diaporthe australafricana TaxID=127596 RepID=A0ABR3Y4J3_9PEZI